MISLNMNIFVDFSVSLLKQDATYAIFVPSMQQNAFDGRHLD